MGLVALRGFQLFWKRLVLQCHLLELTCPILVLGSDLQKVQIRKRCRILLPAERQLGKLKSRKDKDRYLFETLGYQKADNAFSVVSQRLPRYIRHIPYLHLLQAPLVQFCWLP